MRGRLDLGMALLGFGVWFMGLSGGALSGFRKTGAGVGGVSRVRSAMIEMELDHSTGAIRSGAFLHHALQDRRRPIAAENRLLCDQRLRVLDDLPTGGLREELLGEFDARHKTRSVKRNFQRRAGFPE